MSFYSSLYIGKYFLFIPSADVFNPVLIHFRDKTNRLKSNSKTKKSSKLWHKKIYLYPEILQRKWIEYRYKDRFLPSVKYDNVSPLKIDIPPYINIGKKFNIKLKSTDYYYKKVRFLIKNGNRVVFSKSIKSLITNKEYTIETKISETGLFKISYISEDIEYNLKSFIVYRDFIHLKDKFHLHKLLQIKDTDNFYFLCDRCLGRFEFCRSSLQDKYLYMDYIPFNDFLDLETFSIDYINNYIKSLPNPPEYKRGLIHLLNIIRLSISDNEIKIMSNLFRDDPAFAYFITNRLFLFDMIPLINDTELQNILRSIDDIIIARALFTERNEVITKIFNNISKRRVNSIKELIKSKRLLPSKVESFLKKDMNRKLIDDFVMNAKNEINKHIKNYFLQKYGRIIKIPISKMFIYDKIQINNIEEITEIISNTIINNHDNNSYHILHSGNLIVFNRDKLILIESVKKSNECLPYNSEYHGDKIFEIVSVNESAVYLEALIKIKLSIIHIYDWKNNIENIEKLESLKEYSVIPIFYQSEISILTIGALDYKSKPYEQVIRLRIDG